MDITDMRQSHCLIPMLLHDLDKSVVNEHFKKSSSVLQFHAFSEDGIVGLTQVLSEAQIPVIEIHLLQLPLLLFAKLWYLPVDEANDYRNSNIVSPLLQI